MERVEYGTDGYPYKLSMSTRIENTEQYPVVEAIPKDQYEARLKADLEAILVELQSEIEELNMHGSIQLQSYRQKTGRYRQGFERAQYLSTKVIQQKINELKEWTNE